jgi:hypothetical protein
MEARVVAASGFSWRVVAANRSGMVVAVGSVRPGPAESSSAGRVPAKPTGGRP